ncbi:DUF3857 domain-containing protein [Subsaximicrobium wynnwilliamsii]|uniref:DUF3857 domain-containing protein n=2 Tax=Subsaximicrobium wynnwilliamsii TaxID=291179 RepID=A0A5C6ZBU5_9FLAO|nr:DUF3857 domain-containing protein [Subsaximicrobium wynnwilliamsii]TXD86821.1 DUF3857 domain-containing protein [Subsaximicrobium wynnwilliamsii]TXE00429.1 DUF3857 domain-containing protein [Subsaximicrobium wynnwilliamsii]
MVSLKEKTVTEFYFEEDGSLTEYFLEHNVYYLNADDAIERYNKVYLPYASDSNLERNKARVITPSGKVIHLDDSKIMTATNEETNRAYKYFAFEGIEKGSIIEYLYVVKRFPVYKGKRIDFQADFTKNNVEFDLLAPSNLLFRFKSYNGLAQVERDTLSKNKLHWSLKVPQIPLLEEEELAAYEADKKFLIYALDENTASRTKDISSYANVAQYIYENYNTELSRREQSKLEDFLKQIDFNEADALDAKLRAIEFYVKTNLYIASGGDEKLSALEDVLKDKVANESGIVKLYTSIFNALNIEFEFIYTCERSYMRFDTDFEANNFLTDVLFYFPKTKKYMSPTEMESRYGFPPAFLTDTYGLFIKEVVIGDFKSAVAAIEFIKPVAAENNTDTMRIEVAFDAEDLTKTHVKLDKSLSGYYAMYIHPYMDLIKPENKDELIEGFAKNIDDDAEIIEKAVNNGQSKLFGTKPLQFVLDFDSEAFVEKAGGKYLFKVGDLIGRQMEMYQDKKRSLPVENEFQRSYYRTISIAIPEGYEVANLEDINIENVYETNGEELLSFKSHYELNGSNLIITANEHYRVNHIAAAIYEAYRTVINSAADFNKITLVLEPI